MDRIRVSEDQVVPMEDITAGVRGLRIAFVNVFAVTHRDGSWTLVDAGLPYTAKLIRRWTEKFAQKPPSAIVLTHGHFDHASAAPDLAEEWDVPVYAHFLEAPYLTGLKEYPPPNAGAGGTMSLISPLDPRGPINLGVRLRQLPIQDQYELAEMPGWQLLPTPGHTPGHISLFRPADRCLIVGDAFCTTKPESFFDVAITQPPELHGPPAYFTSDWGAARESVRRLAALEPAVVAPGHGRPLGGVLLPYELQKLAERFEEVAVPENRRDSAA